MKLGAIVKGSHIDPRRTLEIGEPNVNPWGRVSLKLSSMSAREPL